MKDCKCGRIPPCYSGRVFNIYEEAKKVKHEWDMTQELWGAMIDKMRAKLMEDDTYHKVYGVNEQLCNLGKTILTKNKDIMEEKKTMKMTKVEAFEYLKHKKVAVTGDTIALQNKLFNIGYKWCDGSIIAMPMVDFLLIDDETFQFTESLSHFRNCGYAEISADDILSIKIVDDKDDIAEKVAFLQARDIMKWLREKQSPHTLMIIDCNHVELLDGVKSEVWKEDME